MTGPERAFRRLITHNLGAPDWSWTPIESRGTVDGIPDLFWAHRTARLSGWLETKLTPGWRVDLRPHQVRWAQSYTRAGVRCAIAVRQTGTGRDGEQRDVLWLLEGAQAARWAHEGLPQALNTSGDAGVLARLTGGPRQWDWRRLAEGMLRVQS